MHWFILVLILLLTLFLVLFITTISIKLMAFYSEEKQQLHVQVRIFFIRYTFDVIALVKKFQKKETKSRENDTKQDMPHEPFLLYTIEKISDMIKSMVDIHTISKDFFRKVKVKQFSWCSYIGTGDAASTGLFSGFIWSVKGLMVGILSTYTKVKTLPKLAVTPVYDGTLTISELTCIFSFRTFHLLYFVLCLFRYMHKRHTIVVHANENKNV
ncbi:DUF2953 domain-containing protein [Ectobacillus sp. sgz5001026]|uniref:DUF2953 domain-containing protein n=1 Tax=Ectobacillus sp. sgz5001026 TaxID=3242473 RepID=UPI0036D39055